MEEPARRALVAHVPELARQHLRALLADPARCTSLRRRWQGMTVDFARQRITVRTLELLLAWAEERELPAKIAAMYRGDRINVTEDRPVLHVALREPDAAARPEVREVRDRIAQFSAEIRDGRRLGATGKRLTDTVSIGIGGSYLGPEFLHEGLRTDPTGAAAAAGRRLRFLSNVDPIDVARALEGLDPETTAVVVVSKTFTTAETMLNGRTLRAWLTDRMGESAVSKHMFAVSTNLEGVKAFGIDPANAFGFWDWVGGRYSVTSAVGLAPLSLQYGYGILRDFLAGAHAVDEHFRTAPMNDNLPVLLGLMGVWNTTFLGYPSRAFLPYCQALNRLPAHLQQVSMESNGKSVHMDGSPLEAPAGPVEFGEPGTNGQHSFYQLIHQGRVVPCDFVGFRASQHPIHLAGADVSSHDELMANFFAQPDALALGKTPDELRAEGVAEAVVPHRTFSGNRPSNVILLPTCNADALGRLLALLEHRTAVEGFLWGVDSFDQWGVELGKVLAKKVRGQLATARKGGAIEGFNPSTRALLADYLGKG
jgi:glucose-6-phosphate isomerase